MTRGRTGIALAAVVGLATGLAFGGALRDRGERPPPAPAPPAAGPARADASELEALRAELAAERRARLVLADEVDQLRWAFEQLVPAVAVEEAESADELAAELEPVPPPAAPGRNQPWFDEGELRERGYDEAEIARLRERFDQSKMEELFLRDQAAREGWSRKPRLFNQLQNIRNSLRSEVGDDTYDALLYATGANNRVLLLDTLATSPAEAADLQRGDVILRYAGENVYSVADLRSLSRTGEAGQPVAVDVLRDGGSVRVYLPRGPLGARLQPGRVPPEGR